MTRLTLLALALTLVPSVARAQPDAQAFEYRNVRRVTGASGPYAGWSDELLASGRYSITAPADAAASVEIHGAYQWRYTSPEGIETGSEDRVVDVTRADRHYVDRTDLDEYDHEAASDLATWVFVPTTLSVGDEVDILDEAFRVVSVDAACDVGGATRSAIQLHAEGAGRRNDAYGDFATRYDDDYWFDRTTGLFLREIRTESDVGTSEGAAAAMRVHEEVHVVDASYAPHVGPIPPDPLLSQSRTTGLGSLPGHYVWLLIGALCVLAFLLFRVLLRSRPPVLVRGLPIAAQKLGATDALTGITPGVSIWFGPLLHHFIDVARRTDNTVWTATIDGVVVGLALDDETTGVATIFAREPDVCEVLRASLKRQDFFSEEQHGNLASVIDATLTLQKPLSGATAYNVLEDYEVLRRASPESPVYDTKVVTRLEDHEIGAAGALLTQVLGAPAEKYLKAALAAGDIAYVARIDGAIVGVGLATVAGEDGRLHTLAVAPAHRNKGLGRELVRARIRAMVALGAQRIITEISAQNSASLEIARGEGFVSVGAMFVETARERAPAKPTTTVRR